MILNYPWAPPNVFFYDGIEIVLMSMIGWLLYYKPIRALCSHVLIEFPKLRVTHSAILIFFIHRYLDRYSHSRIKPSSSCITDLEWGACMRGTNESFKVDYFIQTKQSQLCWRFWIYLLILNDGSGEIHRWYTLSRMARVVLTVKEI